MESSCLAESNCNQKSVCKKIFWRFIKNRDTKQKKKDETSTTPFEEVIIQKCRLRKIIDKEDDDSPFALMEFRRSFGTVDESFFTREGHKKWLMRPKIIKSRVLDKNDR